MLCQDIIVNSRSALHIREKQLAMLTLEHPEVDWGDIESTRAGEDDRQGKLKAKWGTAAE